MVQFIDQNIIDRLSREKEWLIEAIGAVKELDHCVYADSAMAVLKRACPELAKQVFDKFNEDWDTLEWEDIRK